MFGFKKKCPLCGMKEQEGKGILSNGKWFCSEEHLKQYQTPNKNTSHKCC